MKIKKMDYVLIVSFIYMRFLDVIITYYILENNLGIEANLLMKYLVYNYLFIILYNLFLIGLTLFGFIYLNRLKDKTLLNIYEFVVYTLNVIGFTIIYFNSQLIR